MKDEVPPALISAHVKMVDQAVKEGKPVDDTFGLDKSGIAGTGMYSSFNSKTKLYNKIIVKRRRFYTFISLTESEEKEKDEEKDKDKEEKKDEEKVSPNQEITKAFKMLVKCCHVWKRCQWDVEITSA